MKVKLFEHEGKQKIKFWCPGCGQFHAVPTYDGEIQHYSGDLDSPSVHNPMAFRSGDITNERLCVVTMKDGVLTWREDSTHRLAGKTMPMQHEESWRNGGHDWQKVDAVKAA